MELTLFRFSLTPHATYGALLYEGQPVCVTVEDPWYENRRNVSCIPAGEYRCVRHVSKKHGATWRVTNVPDRSGILFHAGNWAGLPGVGSGPMAGHTQGCILLGQSFGVPRIAGNEGMVGVVTSVRAMQKFQELTADETELTLKIVEA